MNRENLVRNYLFLSFIAALLVLVLVWSFAINPIKVDLLEKYEVGLLFIFCCIIGISLVMKPNWVHICIEQKTHGNENRNVKAKSTDSAPVRKKRLGHHPDCDRFDNHVFKVYGWVLCVGDTGVYSAILFSFLWHVFISDVFWNIDSLSLFGLGMLFFTPAIIQLFWKSKQKAIKFLMRFSLGISIYYLLLFVFSFSELYWRLLYLGIFIVGVIIYNQNNSKKHFYE